MINSQFEGIIVLAIGVLTGIILAAALMQGSFKWHSELAEDGYAEYYLDKKNRKKFRMKEFYNKTPTQPINQP